MHFMKTKAKNWLSPVHIWLGRTLLPLGFLNIFSGLGLRDYGYFTIFLVLVVMVVEAVLLAYYMWISKKRNVRLDQGGGKLGLKEMDVGTGAEAEEYFQLAGDDDDEFSDSDTEAQGGRKGREEAERLRRLDRV